MTGAADFALLQVLVSIVAVVLLGLGLGMAAAAAFLAVLLFSFRKWGK